MRTRIRTIGIVFVALLVTDAAAFAQQSHAQYEPPNRGGAGQVLLAKMVGNWTFTDTFFPLRGGKPHVSTGTCQQFMILGGMFLQSNFTFHGANGSTWKGEGISGFSPSTGKFTTDWIDSQRTEMSIRQSRGKFDGKNMWLYAQQIGREHPGRVTFAHAFLRDGGKQLVYDHYYQVPGGKPKMMFEIVLIRQ